MNFIKLILFFCKKVQKIARLIRIQQNLNKTEFKIFYIKHSKINTKKKCVEGCIKLYH